MIQRYIVRPLSKLVSKFCIVHVGGVLSYYIYRTIIIMIWGSGACSTKKSRCSGMEFEEYIHYTYAGITVFCNHCSGCHYSINPLAVFITHSAKTEA